MTILESETNFVNKSAFAHKSLIEALSRPLPSLLKSIALKQSTPTFNTPIKFEQLLKESNFTSGINTSVPLKNYKKIGWQWLSCDSACAYAKTAPAIVSDDRQSVCFHPYCDCCFETSAVRVAKPLRPNAFTYWELAVNRCALSGTSVMFGVGTSSAALASNGYVNLLGADNASWGLSNHGLLWHNNRCEKLCEHLSGFVEESSPNEVIRIGCMYNGYVGTLSYFKNGQFIGVGFSGLPSGVDLYAMCSSTVAKSVVRMTVVCESFPSLKELCRDELRGKTDACHSKMLATTLPKCLQEYLN
jgi:hypothetical protein